MDDQEWKNYLQQWQIPPTDPQLVSKIINKLPRKTVLKPRYNLWQNFYLRFAAVALFLVVNFYLGFWFGSDHPDLLTLALLSE